MPLETLSKNGVNLALYGHGWETNPRLGRFARGIARNGTELNLINNASKIVYHAISTSTFHPRFIDAAASGSFILVKHLESDFDPVARLFENGAEFLYFDGPLDISDKVTYYLNHEDERSKIAANICQKVQSYSYSHFAKSIVEMIATDPLNIKTV
jgi:spore maturation protein CgeB